MKANTTLCAILLAILGYIQSVDSTYQPIGYDRRHHGHGQNFVAPNDPPKTECPPDFTGQLSYAMDCRQYINCGRGRGSIQSCWDGTMFNPETKECDHPSKVKCQRFDGFASTQNQNQRQGLQSNFNRQPAPQRQEHAPIRCENGATGLFAHPLDCRKFLNCDHGRTFIQDCGPGTAFNDVFKVCDWPHKVDCGTRNPNGYTIDELQTEASAPEPFYGEGMLQARSGFETTPFPQQNIRNQQQHPQHGVQNHYQSPQHHQPWHSPSPRPQHQQRTQTAFAHQSNDGINSNSLSSFSSIESADRKSSIYSQNPVNVRTTDTVHDILDDPSPKNQIINIPTQELLPPHKDVDFIGSTEPTQRTGRVDDNVENQIVNIPSQELLPPQNNPESIGSTESTLRTGRVDGNTANRHHPSEIDEWIQSQQETIETNFLGTNIPTTTESHVDHSILRPHKTRNENAPAHPNFNYITTPKPASAVTLRPTSPSTTTARQPTHNPATKVYSIYPSGFETIGAKCEEDGTGLMAHPYDCSRYVSCENGRVRVQSCNSGFMFNPALKMCDFANNVKNCNAAAPTNNGDQNPSEVNQHRVPLSEFPDDKINDIPTDETNNKPFGVGLRSNFDVPATQPTQTDPTPYYIPDMSVLPLQTHSYPQNTYPVEQNRPINGYTNVGLGKPSQGGDIPLAPFDESAFQASNREGKIFTVPTTTEKQHVMRIPSGKEHEMPIYHRPARPTATPSPKPETPFNGLQSSNQVAYQPFPKPFDETKEKETDYIPLNEALKQLSRPYLMKNDSASSNSTEHMSKIENKLLDLMDNSQQANHSKPIEQDSLAAAAFTDNVAVKNLPDVPRVQTRSDFEEEIPPEQQHTEFTSTEPNRIFSYFQLPNHHHSPNHEPHHSHHPSSINGAQHLPESHIDHPYSNQPTNYKPGTNEPIVFPGAHSQSHPMHDGIHHSDPSIGSHYNSPPPHANHPHSGNHAHYGPNYHSNAPNYGLAYNNRHTAPTTPTTASAPPPNWYSTHDKPSAQVRFGKSDFELSTCDGQFDCLTGYCIPFSRLCDGKFDCDNHRDEENCPHVNYQVRLSNDKGHKHMGRVEVKAFDKWGYVCDDKFTLTNANVLCRELGFNMGAAEVKPNSFYPPNANMPVGENIFMMDEVSCMGNETSLKDCDFDGWGNSDCNAEEVVGVVCKVSVMKCPSGHWLCPNSEECIPMSFMCDGLKDCTDETDESPMHCDAKIEYRLMDGSDLEGRIEVKYRGVWGTVCDDDFGEKEAQVFCNSIGFTGPASLSRRKHGMGAGPIWLDQVDCLGNETSLDKCMHFEWSESNCNHTEDVSVTCSYGPGAKSSRYIAHDNTLQRLTTSRETHAKLQDIQRSSKNVPDFSNMCGLVRVTKDDDDSAESVGQFRVISGTRTKRGHHPWQATIRARGRNGRSTHWCGAVIISKTHILTAAHCLIGFPKGAYFIRMGDHHSEIREDSEVEIFIENWHIHDDFRKGQLMNNDIAVVLLKHPIQFTNYIQPICLPDSDTKYEAGKNCTISGWGSIQYGKSTPSLDLKAATVPVRTGHFGTV